MAVQTWCKQDDHIEWMEQGPFVSGLILLRISMLQRTKNKKNYSTGTGPSVLQGAPTMLPVWIKTLYPSGDHIHPSIPILFMYLSRRPLKVTIASTSTTSIGSVFQAPTTICVKNLPRTSPLNLAPRTLNLCPLVIDSSTLGKSFWLWSCETELNLPAYKVRWTWEEKS